MSGPLPDVRVLDLCRALAGRHAAMMPGDLRARAIKIGNPDGGHDSRAWGPPSMGPEDAREPTYFLSYNRNKEPVKRGLLIEVGRPAPGRVRLPGPLLRFDGSAQARHRPPPTLGQRTAGVPRWLGSGT